jgi:hypothetical protein
MVSYDGLTGLALLLDEEIGVLVDVSLCLDNWPEWGNETKGAVMVIGYLERSPVCASLPISRCG